MPESRSKGGKPRARQAAVSIDSAARKEKVLHTRVPHTLDRQLKEKAQNLGLSVSTVVRNVLLNTFGLVEDIVVDSANLAFSIAGDESSGPTGAKRRHARVITGVSDILGWQEATLNVNGVCERCNAPLGKGRKAAIAIRERPGRPTMLCMPCLDDLAGETDEAPRPRRRKQRKR